MRKAKRLGPVATVRLLVARAEVNVKAASTSLRLGHLALFHIIFLYLDFQVLVLDVEP